MSVKAKVYSFNKKPYTQKLIDMNMSHVSMEDDKLLTTCTEDDNPPIVVYDYEEGYFIHISWFPEMPQVLKDYGFSEEFIHIYTRTAALGADFLRLDCDGVGYDDLPVFDWN